LERRSRSLPYLPIMTANIHGLIREIHAMNERSAPAPEAAFRKCDSDFLRL
jgi:hypothetical protein